jgi:excisionase family DNA binding protein
MTQSISTTSRDRLMTYAEVADECGVTVSMVRKLVGSRQLRNLSLGHCTKRIRQSEFDAFLKRRSRR